MTDTTDHDDDARDDQPREHTLTRDCWCKPTVEDYTEEATS